MEQTKQVRDTILPRFCKSTPEKICLANLNHIPKITLKEVLLNISPCLYLLEKLDLMVLQH